MTIGAKIDGDGGRSYEGTTIFGDKVARVGAQSKSRRTPGTLGVNGKASMLNGKCDRFFQSDIVPSQLYLGCSDDESERTNLSPDR